MDACKINIGKIYILVKEDDIVGLGMPTHTVPFDLFREYNVNRIKFFDMKTGIITHTSTNWFQAHYKEKSNDDF